mmetsp:Transcript_5295/g.33262  ORF Transcript_5295/g.33262 Transcript_5295/m.33262 type:complete len:201 (+) Transcript_5295:663-1265(+)
MVGPVHLAFCIHQQQQQIAEARRSPGRFDLSFVIRIVVVLRSNNTRRIVEQDLGVAFRQHANDFPTRRVRFGGDGRHLSAHQVIDQRRFPSVGHAQDAHAQQLSFQALVGGRFIHRHLLRRPDRRLCTYPSRRQPAHRRQHRTRGGASSQRSPPSAHAVARVARPPSLWSNGARVAATPRRWIDAATCSCGVSPTTMSDG